MKQKKHNHYNRRGYATISTVVLTGVISFVLFNALFKDTLNSQENVRESIYRQDSQVREDAFLDSLLVDIPRRAMETMISRSNVTWESALRNAINSANVGNSTPVIIKRWLGVSGVNGDPADLNTGGANLRQYVNPFSFTRIRTNWVNSGTSEISAPNLPPPLVYSNANADRFVPLISKEKKWGSAASGYVSLPVAEYSENNIMPVPDLLFNVTGDRETFVGKRNWWTLDVNFSGDHSSKTDFTRYLFSIYELPSQSAINSTSLTNLGQHSNDSDWSRISVSGSVYGRELNLEGSQDFDFLASQRETNFDNYTGELNGLKPSGKESYESLFTDQGAKSLYQLENNTILPVSVGQDSGRVAFLNINRGDDFYDLYKQRTYTNIISDTNWDEYSHGATQCAMRVVVTEMATSLNQTPLEIEFSYFKDGVRTTTTYNKTDSTWPLPGTAAGDAFPFHSQNTETGRNSLGVYIERIPALLSSLGADETAVNHSLLVQVDYNQPSIVTPSPTNSNHMAVVLLEGEDLSAFSRGFSVVTMSTMFIADDLNLVEGTPPKGSTVPLPYYPPLSLFSPETRYGISIAPRIIDIEGQIGNISNDNSKPTNILDLKSGQGGAVVPENIKANLTDITHPDQLAPIHTINWLITIEKVEIEEE